MNTVDTGAPGATTDPTAQPTRPAPRARAGRLRRGLAMAAVIAAGAGVVGLGTSVGSASAEPAPAHAGWDGSRYWFKNSSGAWRWTSHYEVYRSRTTTAGATATRIPTGSGTVSASGLTQGWDGSVYWFRNSSGAWRWTSHRDVYLDRTGGGDSSSDASDASDASDQSDHNAPSASGDVEDAVQFALDELGTPFVMGGNGPDGYDCSGLVQQAYRHAGISLPRIANDQYEATTPITAAQLQRGDLLFWSDDGSARGIHHVAIYLGGNQYVEAAHPGTDVRISKLSSGYYPTQMGRP
ncbi:C40 family peptidase [Kitasatospora sp. NBC_00315]|uniref:C40 family peptidase n=1 Tax=Kitasatospora sp. NBC_00315 TaxID=2975963 RepID=UPI00324CB4E6